MANYSDIGTVATAEDFRRRVAYALTKAAIDVYAEVGTTQGHAARALYATRVLNSQFDLHGAVLGVLSNASIAAEASSSVNGNGVPDADIQFAINSIFSVLAGA